MNGGESLQSVAVISDGASLWEVVSLLGHRWDEEGGERQACQWKKGGKEPVYLLIEAYIFKMPTNHMRINFLVSSLKQQRPDFHPQLIVN